MRCKPRILIIEDDRFLGQELRHILLDLGVNVIGPISGIPPALSLIHGLDVDAALLSTQIDHEPSSQVAVALDRKEIPFAWIEGWNANADLYDRFPGKPRLPARLQRDQVAAAIGCLGVPVIEGA